MSDLRIIDIHPDLLAHLKSKAALAKITLREYVVQVLTRDWTRKNGGRP